MKTDFLSKLTSRFQKFILSGETLARLAGVKVGKDCRILIKEFGSEPFLISIGDRVTISSKVTFINHDGAGWLVRDEAGRRFIYRPIRIGNGVFIGAGSIIMPGVHIGNNVIVGAGSVVTKSVEDDSVVAGNPARFITTFQEFHQRALHWPTEEALASRASYRERVLSAVDEEPKPMLQRGRNR